MDVDVVVITTRSIRLSVKEWENEGERLAKAAERRESKDGSVDITGTRKANLKADAGASYE
jgi:hypothetical protein